MTADENKTAALLLQELEGESREYPHASELAADLRLLLDRAQLCLIVWTENNMTELWSVKLEQGAEMDALCEAHGNYAVNGDASVELLRQVIDKRGRRVIDRTEGRWMVAHILVI